jgi:hypothetical protein
MINIIQFLKGAHELEEMYYSRRCPWLTATILPQTDEGLTVLLCLRTSMRRPVDVKWFGSFITFCFSLARIVAWFWRARTAVKTARFGRAAAAVGA